MNPYLRFLQQFKKQGQNKKKGDDPFQFVQGQIAPQQMTQALQLPIQKAQQQMQQLTKPMQQNPYLSFLQYRAGVQQQKPTMPTSPNQPIQGQTVNTIVPSINQNQTLGGVGQGFNLLAQSDLPNQTTNNVRTQSTQGIPGSPFGDGVDKKFKVSY